MGMPLESRPTSNAPDEDDAGGLPGGMEILRLGESEGAGEAPRARAVAEPAGVIDPVVHHARQGHPYLWKGYTVICLEGGSLARVMYLPEGQPYFFVESDQLTPLPLAYYGQELP